MIRDEAEPDVEAIGPLITDAFRTAPHSSGSEAMIVAGLRRAGALTLSLIAVEDEAVVGHVAFSPVKIDGSDQGWFALGPIAVRPDRQGRGIGAALIRAGLERLRAQDAQGCVLVGDPTYYARFGFQTRSGLWMTGVPSEYVLSLPLAESVARGKVTHHPAFFPDRSI